MTNPERREKATKILEEYHKSPISTMTSEGTTYSIDQALSALEDLMPEVMSTGDIRNVLINVGRGYNIKSGSYFSDVIKALTIAKPVMTKEEVEKVIFALKKARVFIEYARYELDDGKATIGSQFPHKEDADIETTRLKEAIDLASKLIGRG